MTKEELLDKEKQLEIELADIKDQLENYKCEELKEKYGDKFHCKYCRHSCVLGFSGEG